MRKHPEPNTGSFGGGTPEPAGVAFDKSVAARDAAHAAKEAARTKDAGEKPKDDSK